MHITFSFNEYPQELPDDITEVPHSSSGEVRVDSAEHITPVLNAFVRFLKMAGFDYVHGVTAHADYVEHKSTY